MESSVADAQSETGEIQSSLLTAKMLDKASRVVREMSEEDIKLQAQEFIYRQTLRKEKPKAGRHALEEVGRSLNAIAQRRRQYFLEYKNCNSIRCVRQWYAWESKRNLETNVIEARSENAATRGIRMFLHRVDFYGTLLARFVEYILRPLQTRFSTTQGANPELESVKEQMKQMRATCESLLSDNTEVLLDNVNHIEAEQRFPIISVLPRVHATLNKMVMLAFQWRIHASFEQRFEQIDHRRSLTETERGLNDKRKTLRAMEHNIRRNKRSHELLEEEIGARMQAISTSNFSQVYAECTERIEAVREAYQQCKANLENTESTIKTVQQSFGKYKIVGQKQKKKLESSLLRRTRKSEELEKIKAELDRLENRKVRLDEEEVIWLRGGYENEVGVIESLKEQSYALEKNLLALEQQKEDLKVSYEQSMEQVLKLSTDFEELSHKYEYVKRLASIMIATLWSNTEPQILVKPNKMDIDTVQEMEAYDMTQPKGVAMLVYNKWSKAAKPSPEKGKPKQATANEKKTDLGHNLESLLAQLGFYVIKRTGLSTTSMRKNMAGLSDQYHGYSGNHNSMMVVFVANCNERGQIVGSGDAVVSVKEFLSHFSTSRCPTLMGKPKIFLFLLKVVSREPVLPMVDEILGKQSAARKSTRLSADSDMPVYFEPEPLTPEDDFLVARVMFEDDAALDGGPTFGGVGASQAESDMPWFTRSLLSILSQQAGTTDLAEVMRNVKKSFRDHFASPRSDGSGDKRASSDSSPFGSMGRTSQQRDDHVNLFVDSSLTRKLYLMPGL